MGKSKKADVSREENGDESVTDGPSKQSWEDKVRYLSPIASPLASKKLTKKLYKMVGKAHGVKSLRKGIKEVQKSLRKGEKGIVVLAGDVSPMDIISHIPVVCEEADIPYCYTPSKSELGESCGSKRQACMVMIKKHDSYGEDFDELRAKVGEIPTSY
ncbi:H/ACA ribonucleoprotein complex subunit 2-like protein [Plakobranchus ocellatus]|uniref:H/ACA ribonucleoprotein complex subunit 2 n=1 Tax=Plakobranchus ocellatus TaxID=259542 RepID=A0AAV4CF53_9GAST|nr:H/ACA ribonucleoprotein complex subunit 2-like protein [Plakobranchus ocellatus]